MKSEPADLIGAVLNIVFLQNLPGFLLVKMVRDKIFGHVLSLGVADPALASRMVFGEFGEIIALTINNPQVFQGRVVVVPELSISVTLLLEPDGSGCLEASRGQGLSFNWDLLDLH